MKKAEPSDTYLHSGYRQATIHTTSTNSPRPLSVNFHLLVLVCEYWRYSDSKNKSKSSNSYFKAYEQKRYSVS